MSNYCNCDGAPWSCGHIHLLTAPRVGRSNPQEGRKKTIVIVLSLIKCLKAP